MARAILTTGGLIFILLRARTLGLREIAEALPTSAFFYAAAIAGYFVLPLFDLLIYRRLLMVDFGLLLRKRALNEVVLDYAGEVEFLIALRRQPGAARAIKDVNVLSGLVSNVATVGFLAILIALGQADFLNHLHPGLERAATALTAGTVVIVVCLVTLQRHILSLPSDDLLYIARLHVFRIAVTLALLIAQWHFALPGVDLGTWFLFLSAWMLITRLPFLPSRDVLLASLGLALGTMVHADQRMVAAMFIAGAGVAILFHAAVLIVTTFGHSQRPAALKS